ncbi:cupin domain-containing protein [Draconibacterium sp. IB214405]|uniref:cupin domain-containing protein n=1 Tax=Draconibacterium sp. IB214405 TaxID=3097352 RepID=UPI002A1401A5|nr:cupin domain-containing protein [Draconibacterium sp. IB214405]MDX8341247.1 cupin domain-containing protein [Draconibacterium sp. IB214405]
MKRTLIILSLLAILLSCMSVESETDGPKVETLLQATQSWDGSELPSYPEGKPEISILKVSIPPHSQLDLHKHEVINAGILLSGNLTVITENSDTLKMKTGDVLSEVVGTWHYGVNEGDDIAEIVVFYAGTVGTPLSIHAE